MRRLRPSGCSTSSLPACVWAGEGRAARDLSDRCRPPPAPQLLYFIMNSWCNLGWFAWPVLERMSPVWLMRHAVAAIRALAPPRLVAAYGVFPPGSMPPQKWGER